MERQSYEDIAGLPRVLRDARARRSGGAGAAPLATATSTRPDVSEPTFLADAPPIDPGDDGPTLFEV